MWRPYVGTTSRKEETEVVHPSIHPSSHAAIYHAIIMPRRYEENARKSKNWKRERTEKQESIETMESENQRRVMQACPEGNEERGALYVCDFGVVVIWSLAPYVLFPLVDFLLVMLFSMLSHPLDTPLPLLFFCKWSKRRVGNEKEKWEDGK